MPTTVQQFTGVYRFVPTNPAGSPQTNSRVWTYNSVWTKVGTQRPKPKRWKPPAAYSRSSARIDSALAVNLRYEQVEKGSQNGYTRQYFGDFVSIAPNQVISLPEPTTQQHLLNQALKGMVDSKFNLLTSIAEFRKTAEHLASTARRITDAVKYVKRGRFSRAASRLGIVTPKGVSRSRTWASNWLEYKYGWMPLLSDAYGIAEVLASQMRDEAPIFQSRKRAKDMQNLPETAGFTNASTFRVDYRIRTSQEVRQQVCLYYQVDFGSLLNLKQLGLLDPAATAWERVPWSFVADWFLPVGEWLSLANAWQGLIYKGGCYTVFKKSHTRVDMTASRCTSSTSAMVYDGGEQVRPGLSQYFTVQRSVIYDPQYRMQVKSPVSFDHAITAIALLRQQFR